MPSPSVKDFNEVERRYSEWIVEDATAVRRPLPSAIETTLRLFGDKKKLAAHDKLFHLFLETTLRDPLTGERHVVRTERNETLGARKVSDSERVAREYGEEALPIDLAPLAGRQQQPLTYGDMIDRARDRHARLGGSKDFTTYSLSENNCQMFVKNVLEANGLYDEATHGSFVDQKAETLVPSWSKRILNGITGLGERFSNWRAGTSADVAKMRPSRNPRLRFHTKYTEPAKDLTYEPFSTTPETPSPVTFTNVASSATALSRQLASGGYASLGGGGF